ncbi:replication protein A 70 kDa DNA-binding subunit-like isoform X3 [Schistocerca serialis cubense]|uniref:replication protein A 70 kDa DNA-binding subunit-like isoform X3 n=1 Tax=Schistocerca serialis cubense TaxID=2023355 RepID=UPI00214E0CF0|nr:replication protein A 70 kDa DNA-binding subunit-like isoform X3 [Schistocerca serialis cubense]
MTWQLTEGALATIMRGGTVEDPVMQILGSGRIDGAGSSERYHLQVSDGYHQNSAMLATELKDKLTSGELSEYSVVRLNHWMLNSGERGTECVIVIVDLTILASGTEVGVKIGEPAPFREDSSTGAACDEQSARPVLSPPALSQPQKDDTTGSTSGSILPIADLSPGQKEWEIKARVVNKTAMIRYVNNKGKRFSMELVDSSGHIHATAFGEQCDEFYDLIKEGRVYFISRGKLNPTNKKFTSVNHHYQMTFTRWTTVRPCKKDDTSIPHIAFNFVSLNKLADTALSAVIDVIGVVKDTGSVEDVIVKKRNEREKKREVTIVDQSNTTVKLTLWGTQAEEFSATPGCVLAVKGAKQSDFGGRRSASVQMWNTVRVNPDIPEAHQLRDWYQRQEHVNISTEQLEVAGTAEYTPPQPKQKICPVAKLSPYREKWRIEARVVNKRRGGTPNESGEGGRFSVEFVDKSGEILATAFDEQCDRFYGLIEEERVYAISECNLKPANKRFSSVNHDYQMIFTDETTVESCNEDDLNIPRYTFHFKPLNKLPDIDLAVDIIGVVNTIGSVEVVTVRATNMEEKKRDITIVDQSNTTMKLTLWGKQAEEFSEAPGSVLAVRSAKQSDFGGQRSASVQPWSTVKVNPDIPEAHELRDWYHSVTH